ncbi:MAG: FkbM family methyltransferase [Candidatus Doudnabacteria bacterium]|nr:FkbM family methyltransferase [Candidatus Doudnabacteria bacterium]
MLREHLFLVFKYCCKKFEGSGITKYRIIGSAYTKVFRDLRQNGISLEKVGKHSMYLDLNDVTCMRMAMFDFEPTTSQTLKKILKPGMTFLDIGAHVGYFALEASELVGGSGRIYAFEPEEKNFMLLRRNADINQYKNIVPNNLAASNKNRNLKIFLSEDSGRHTTKKNLIFRYKTVKTIKAITIDYFCSKNKIRNVDAIKLDVEGGEPEALDGMKNTIRKNKNLKMIVEYSPENFSANGDTPGKFMGRLASLGFRKFFLLDKNEIKETDANKILELKKGVYNILAEK